MFSQNFGAYISNESLLQGSEADLKREEKEIVLVRVCSLDAE